MAAPIAAPIPRSHAATASMRKDSGNLQSNDDGRATPLPQYEKHQSVPFTLALQEEKDNPGQFQLVVNVDPNYKKSAGGTTLKPSLSKKLIANLQEAPREAPSLGYDVSQMYQTQKSSPPSTPSEDRQGWSELDAIPSEFLQKVVPDWNVTFSRSDSTASHQARKLADIKARIKKSGKGFIVRLLKASNTDTDEVAEVHLGRNSVTKLPTLSELDSTAAPAELDAANAPVAVPSVPANVFEIGSSGERGIERDYERSPAISTSIPQWLSQTSNETGLRFSTIEDTFSDAETLLPDVRSVVDRMEDHTDIEPASNCTSVLPTRSNSVLSIVKTPTRGLSVVGPVQRIQKGPRMRSKGKGVRPDLNRAGARKSQKVRSPQSSMSEDITWERLRKAAAAALAPDSEPHPTSSSSEDTSDEERSDDTNSIQRPIPYQEQNPAKTKIQQPSSSLTPSSSKQGRTRLSLQTNLPKTKSANTSPISRRKRSPRTVKARNSHPTTPIAIVEESEMRPLWEEIESDDHREALEKSFGSVWSEVGQGVGTTRISAPTIEEPMNDEDVGHFALPPGLEIRSAPSSSGNRFAMYCGLAVGAILDKVVEGIQYARATYGSEQPVPANHVRVRWTCSCGEPLYDDFIERRPGAARLLEAYLNRPRAHTPMSPNSRSSTSTSMSSLFDSMSRASTLPTPSSTYAGPSSWGKMNDSSKHSPIRVKSNPFSIAIGQPVEDAWLLTCANEGRFTPKIVHLDVNSSRIRSDKDLAFVLREHYEHLNRRWLKWTRLRGLTTIEFTQFEVHRNRFADIRATPSMPPTSSTSNEKAPSQHPYTFESVDLIPPVGSAYLLHLFKHPEDYDGELITYLRAPKRRERLEFGMGWGINLVEGFHAQKVWAVIMACFGAGSAVFGILWTIKKDDVQGAFGVAGWVVTLAALVLGALQAWLE